MKISNRKQTITHLQEMHMRWKAIKAVRNFLRKPKFKVIKYCGFKEGIAKACIETWAKQK